MNKKSHIKSHDHFIKKAMSRPRVALEFFESYLPQAVLEIVDLQTLKQANNNALSNELGEGVVDLLYSVKFGKDDGYISILLEHQSTPDKYMTFRIQKYILRLCDEHLRQHPNSALPLIYPIILYTGNTKYDAKKSLHELFAKPELAKQFLNGETQVVDLQTIDDEELKQKYYSGAMLYIMRHIYEKEILPFIKEIMPILTKVSGDDTNYIKDVIQYLIEKAETQNREAVFEEFSKAKNQEIKGVIMTIAEELRQEGRETGIQLGMEKGVNIGMEKGMEKGELAGKLQVARKMLSKGQDVDLIAELTDLSLAEVYALKHN